MSDLAKKLLKESQILLMESRQDQQTRILAIDFGLKKLGLALSDRSKTIASPLTIIHRTNIDADLNQIRQIIAENNVTIIMVGMPFELDGSIGKIAELVMKFAKKLEEKTKLKIGFIDERFSSWSVQEMLIKAGVKRKKRDAIDDKLAASYFLQSLLDSIEHANKLS